MSLGFAMEALILTVRLAAGSHPATTLVLIELAQGVTWAFFVCAGLSLRHGNRQGTSLARRPDRRNLGTTGDGHRQGVAKSHGKRSRCGH
ncbi:hypothetical protein MES4922_130009 [Mesorhizobium ventifaucium]|uniref:Uncharacterized protein n=1 Tax=Mesorhizobium ventifaucium TaxID=666020 RepID=A0ABN8JEB9_9HYPH|nr:hypothetical protein MES4922_130009 [Mesorhizobium ventifaucium]